MEEDLITPQSKLTEEAPISFKRFSQEESAPPQSQGPRPFQHHTSVDSSKPPTFHPIKFSAPKPFSNRLGPEPFRPASFKPVAMREKGVKQDMMQRRSDFFSKAPDPDQLPLFGYSGSTQGASLCLLVCLDSVRCNQHCMLH